MSLFNFGANRIDLAKKLTEDERRVVIMAVSSSTSSAFPGLQSAMLASELNSGKRTWITKEERRLVRSAIDEAIEKLTIVRFVGNNEEYLKLLTAAKRKL